MSHFNAEKEQAPLDFKEVRKQSIWFRLLSFWVGTRKRFYLSIVYFAAFALLLVAILHYAISNRESNQVVRNAYLQAEVSKLWEQIAEVEKLKVQTHALLDRAEIAKILLSRSQMETRILDQLACHTLPNEIYLTEIGKDNDKYTLHGVADTRERVNTLANALEKGPLYSGKVVQVSEAAQSGDKKSSGTVSFIIEASSSAPENLNPSESAEASSSGKDDLIVSKLEWLAAVVVVLAALFWGLARAPRSKNNDSLARLGVLGSIIAIMTAACWFVVSSELDTLDKLDEKESGLKQAYLYEKRIAINLDLINKQLLDTQKDMIPFLKKLPNGRDSLNDEIKEATRLIQANGLRIIDNHPDDLVVKRGAYIFRKNWAIKVSGSFDHIGHFMSDLSRANASLHFQSYKLIPVSADVKNGEDFILDATLNVFRHLDDDELAAQGKANSEGEK